MNSNSACGKGQTSLIASVGIVCLLLIALGTRDCWFHWPGLEVIGSPLLGTDLLFRPWGLLGLGGLLQIGLAVWVGFDAQRRGLNGFLWALLVLFTFIVGLIVYLIVAPGMSQPAGQASVTGLVRDGSGPPARHCPHCDGAMEATFKVCPYCGTSLRCRQCNQAIEAGWKVCAHCGTALAQPQP